MEIKLPAGYTARPLTLADAEAVTAVIRAEEEVDLGAPDVTLEDVLGEWQRASFDIGSSTVGVFDEDGSLVASGELAEPTTVYSAVHPEHQGRGIGTAIAHWLQATARERGSSMIGSQVPKGGPADRLMADLGYVERWTAWDLELPEGAEIEPQPLPDGFALSSAEEGDHEAAYRLIEDAFSEWDGRDPVPFDDFAARVWGRPGFEPWNLRLLRNADGEPVGATHVYLSDDAGYVARIAVRPDHRGLGLARAMLVDAFGLAREHGAVRSYLSTDDRTGALGLYERVGMVVSSTWVNRALQL